MLNSPDISASRLSNLVANLIRDSYDAYAGAFTGITARAADRFTVRDWAGALADAAERLDLYGCSVDRAEGDVRDLLGPRVKERLVWAGTKAVFSALIGGRDDWEVAETFYNSITRRIFVTEGVDRDIEFVDSDFEPPQPGGEPEIVVPFEAGSDAAAMFAAILGGAGIQAPFADLERDSAGVADRVTRALAAAGGGELAGVEVVAAPFYRRKGAYLVGRAWGTDGWLPLALALLHTEGGVSVDAVLTDEDDISILFSFAQSHFSVATGPAHRLVHYLKALLPRKPIAELYIAIGHHKHGKTELYRDVLRHLAETDERFVRAPGTPGLVMLCFTMPGDDVVLKVIRDRFPAIKPLTAGTVRQKYHLVFRHDRAGRLVEAQEFEHLKFDRSRFSEEVLEECGRDAAVAITGEGPDLVLHHAYIERKVVPLNLYLKEAPAEAAEAAVIDFGQAIKDLAANGIFPGELLPKNFGVTRHGRVVCYDYDELGFLTDFEFRVMPEAEHHDDEIADEAWYGAGPNDVFPEEMPRFIGLSPELAAIFSDHHGDLYQTDFWTTAQARVRAGEIVDVFPYRPECRLHPDAAAQ